MEVLWIEERLGARSRALELCHIDHVSIKQDLRLVKVEGETSVVKVVIFKVNSKLGLRIKCVVRKGFILDASNHCVHTIYVKLCIVQETA